MVVTGDSGGSQRVDRGDKDPPCVNTDTDSGTDSDSGVDSRSDS